MTPLHTGKTYELKGTPTQLREVWPAVKKADPKAVFVTADSDNIGVIGTNVLAAMTLGKQSLNLGKQSLN